MIEKVNNDGDEHDKSEVNRVKEVNDEFCAFANDYQEFEKNLIEQRTKPIEEHKSVKRLLI